MSRDIPPYPEPDFKDRARQGFDVAIAAVPVVGGSVSALIDVILKPSLEKRRDAWFGILAEVVEEIRRRGDVPAFEDLVGNESFTTAVIEASRIALGTHLEEKLEILKNCLINCALGVGASDLVDRQMFKWVDELSPEHFLVMKYMDDPRAWYRSHGLSEGSYSVGSPKTILDGAGLGVGSVELQIVLTDLELRRLANVTSLKVTMTGEGMWQPLLTDLGKSLLRFVELV